MNRFLNVFKQRFRSFVALLGLLMVAFVVGCGGSDGGSTQPGVLAVSLTDAPACGFDEVNVTVSKVRIHPSDNANENGGGWREITLSPPRKINLLNLNDPTQPNFALEHLGETPLEPGHYTQLRLVLIRNTGNPNSPENSVVLSDTKEVKALETPSAIHSGVKLIHQFTVESGQRVDLLLDFDACKSVVQRSNGTYALKPVIKVIPFELNGIAGFVDKALIDSNVNVVVSAQLNGEVVRTTVPNAEGKFFLARLVPADYDVVVMADHPVSATGGHGTAVVTDVPVPSSTSITSIGTETHRIGLDDTTPPRTVSGNVTLNPATDEETVFVTGKQTLDGHTVTVKSQPAMVVDGNPIGDLSYEMTLPSGAPKLGSYNSGTLPIVFTPQPAAAGHYDIEISANGYVTQSAAADISGGDTNMSDVDLLSVGP